MLARQPNYAISLCAALLAGTLACRPAEEIRTYRVAKSETEAAAPIAAQPVEPATPSKRDGDPTHRMLAAIVPGSEQAWFFKAVAPAEVMAVAADGLTSFYRSLEAGGDRPAWELPEGWTEQTGSGMRLATIVVPTVGTPIELSVIGLPSRGEWDAYVRTNVDRWRGQMGLPTGGDDGVAPLAEVGEQARLVDLAGWFDDGGMAASAPFAAGAPPKPAAPSAPAPPVAPSGGLSHTPPDGWTDKPGSAMRKASLATPGGAEVTAYSFPNVAAMSDPLSNVNRWRGEVGLAPTTAEDLADSDEEIELLGEPGRYYELVGESETTLVAMTSRGQSVWFFKLRGPGEEATAQRDEFRAWLASAKIE